MSATIKDLKNLGMVTPITSPFSSLFGLLEDKCMLENYNDLS